jgi:hypothetical protein
MWILQYWLFTSRADAVIVVVKEGGKMYHEKPVIVHIAAMLDELEEAPLRAAYMVVSELHSLQAEAKKKKINHD